MTTPWNPEQRKAAKDVISSYTKEGRAVPSDVHNYLSSEQARSDSPYEIRHYGKMTGRNNTRRGRVAYRKSSRA